MAKLPSGSENAPESVVGAFPFIVDAGQSVSSSVLREVYSF